MKKAMLALFISCIPSCQAMQQYYPDAPPASDVQVGGDESQCMEDQPCWDCHTMGNHICGTNNGY